jgi:hypothetical protein
MFDFKTFARELLNTMRWRFIAIIFNGTATA